MIDTYLQRRAPMMQPQMQQQPMMGDPGLGPPQLMPEPLEPQKKRVLNPRRLPTPWTPPMYGQDQYPQMPDEMLNAQAMDPYRRYF